MTPTLKELLHSYGVLYITMMTLQGDRPGNPHASLRDYYDSLGKTEPGEPVLVVRISADGESRFLRQRADQLPPDLVSTYGHCDVTIMELPEDEFHFFSAFRPGAFDLEKQLPSFLLQMALVHAHTLFENYIANVIRWRLRAHPEQVGLKKQITVADLLNSESKEALLDNVIENELNQIMYLPIMGILDTLRNKYGLRPLSTAYDSKLEVLSRMRNCLVHNAGKADPRLSAADQSHTVGDMIEVSTETLTRAIGTYRKFCALVDLALETVGGAGASGG